MARLRVRACSCAALPGRGGLGGASAFDHPHLLFVVVVAGGGGEVGELLSCSALSWTSSAATFSSTRDTRFVPGIGAMSSPWASSQANEHLRRGAPDLGGDGLDLVGAAQVVLEVLAGEARVGLAEVGVRQVVDRAHVPGEEAAAQRRVGHEADAQLAQHRQRPRPRGPGSTASTPTAGR